MNNSKDNPLSVLLVDDDEEDFIIIQRILARIAGSPYELKWCSSFDRAKTAIANHEHDVYLVDYQLGDHTGLELLEFADPQKRSEPFILLTGAGDAQIEEESMKLGAVDYLIKGTFKAELLSRTLNYALGRKEIEEQRLKHYVEINRTKDEFISLASHQLRTPATGVKQYVGMVIEGLVGEITFKQREILMKAYESNERQLIVVSDLLKVAQMDAGKVKLQFAEVNLVALVSDVVKEQKQTYTARNQLVKFVHDAPPVTAIIDGNKVRMVVENLLDNASKYSDIGKIIKVEVIDGESEVLIKIIDHGVGIKQEDYGKLFEKFSRIHNPLSNYVGGTGLGLYWAKKIVDLHGGRISFTTKDNKGTTFSVYLPKERLASILEEVV